MPLELDDDFLRRFAQALAPFLPVATAPPPVTPTAPPSAGLFSEYNSAFFGTHAYMAKACDAQGNPTGAPYAAYTTRTPNPKQGLITWGDSTEHHAILRGADGQDWCAIVGYEDTSTGKPSSGMYWPVETVRADWTDLDTGATTDISNLFGAGPTGQPSLPNALPSSGRRRIRVWHWVHKSTQQGGGRDRVAFWQGDLEFGKVTDNPCWQGPAPRARQAVIWREAWWDTTTGWTERGKGRADPWLKSGDQWRVADPGAVTFTGYSAYGRGAGALWAYQYDDFRAAVVSFS